MALELRVKIELVNTDPQPPDVMRVLVRGRRDSTLTSTEGADLAGEFAVARHRLRTMVEEVAVDVDSQLEIAEANARLA